MGFESFFDEITGGLRFFFFFFLFLGEISFFFLFFLLGFLFAFVEEWGRGEDEDRRRMFGD